MASTSGVDPASGMPVVAAPREPAVLAREPVFTATLAAGAAALLAFERRYDAAHVASRAHAVAT